MYVINHTLNENSSNKNDSKFTSRTNKTRFR